MESSKKVKTNHLLIEMRKNHVLRYSAGNVFLYYSGTARLLRKGTRSIWKMVVLDGKGSVRDENEELLAQF